MAQIINAQSILHPLTRDVFDGDTPLYGVIEAYAYDDTVRQGVMFSEFDVENTRLTGRRFVHPSLFAPLVQQVNLFEHVLLRLTEEGTISCHYREPGTTWVDEELPISAPPLEVQTVSLTAIRSFYQQLYQQSHCGLGEACTGASFMTLDPNRTVLVVLRAPMGATQVMMVCQHCFKKHRETTFLHRVEYFLDGGSFMHHAPVSIVAGGCGNR